MRYLGIILLSLFSLFFTPRCEAGIKSLRKVDFKALGMRSPFQSRLPEKIIEEEVKIIQRPRPEAAIVPPEIVIQGIVWGGPFPQAIIANQVIREGDVLAMPEPVTILEIKPREIVVLFKKKLFTYRP